MRELLSSLDMADEAALDPEDEETRTSSDPTDQQQDGEGEAEQEAQGDRAEIEIADDGSDGYRGRRDAKPTDAPAGELPEDADDGDSEEACEAWRPPAGRRTSREAPTTRPSRTNSTRSSRPRTCATPRS